MKKITILLTALTVVSATYAKEIIPITENPATMATTQSNMYLNARFGGDFEAKYNDSFYGYLPSLTSSTTGFGGEIALEGYQYLNDNFDIGVGFAYQFHADRDTATFENGSLWSIDGMDYDSIPIYLTAKYKFNTNSNIKPYLKINFGYSFNFNSSDYTAKSATEEAKFKTDIDNGSYLAFGGGMEYNNFTMDLMYATTKAKVSIDNHPYKGDNDYERLVLSVGYIFNL